MSINYIQAIITESYKKQEKRFFDGTILLETYLEIISHAPPIVEVTPFYQRLIDRRTITSDKMASLFEERVKILKGDEELFKQNRN